MNDSLATELINTGVNVASNIKGGNLINGVPNEALGFIGGLIYALIHRAIEKRRLRKKGLLIDKSIK